MITADQQAEILASTTSPTILPRRRLLQTLNPDPIRPSVRGANNGTGTGLAEVYDLSPTAPAVIANFSTRGYVWTEDDVLIGGFIVGGSESLTVVVSRRSAHRLPRLAWLTPSPIQSSTRATLTALVTGVERHISGPTPNEKP